MRLFGNCVWRGGRIIVAILGLSILATACSQTNQIPSSSSMNHGAMDGMGHSAAPVAVIQTAGEHSESHSYSAEITPAPSLDHGAMDGIGHTSAPVAVTQTMGGHSDTHGNSGETSSSSTSDKGLILGGFGMVNGIVIALAAILKTRTPKKEPVTKIVSSGGLGK